MKANGYRYVHLGSWWEPTRQNPLADENFVGLQETPLLGLGRLNEFEWLLVDSTLPARIATLLFGVNHDNQERQFYRVQRKFEKLASLKRQGAPLFVFAHMLIPHDPYVFFADGRYKNLADREILTRNENYIDQLRYTNTRIRELVEALLDKRPQPVIILQADEGPFPKKFSEGGDSLNWREATAEELKQKFRILNALYFPNREYGDLYRDITPVNTFRILFNHYFEQNLPLLPDISFLHNSSSDLYSFSDVTEMVR